MRSLVFAWFFVLFFGVADGVFAAETSSLSGSEAVIHTFGGGELLGKTFAAVGKILYGASGEGSTFQLLLRLALTIGAFCAVCVAFFRQQFEPLIRSFFLPGLAICALFLAPTTSVAILDHHAAKPKIKEVEQKVPFFFGKLAVYSSEAIYQLKELFSDALGEKGRYSWSRQIGGELPFQISLNRGIEENFQEFCRECVVRDLDLGLYGKQEFKKETDLFTFWKGKTAKTRSMFYRGEEESGWISCREAIEKIDEALGSKKGKHPLVDPASFKQRVACSLLSKTAVEKKSLFAAAAAGIIAMQSFVEAVLYLLFPIVILLSLLSFGFRIIVHWIRLLLWILIWPIFYVVADLFLNSIWDFRKAALLGDVKGVGLSHFESLIQVYESMEMLSLFVFAAVPILSWILIKGSMSGFTAFFSSSFRESTHANEHKESAREPSVPESPTQNFISKGFPKGDQK